MNARLPRFPRLRATLLGALAFAALATACESPLPTSAEVQKMDVAAVEARVVQLQPGQQGAAVTYYVDGKQVSREQARALPANQIVRVDVRGAAGAAAGNTVTIQTARNADVEASNANVRSEYVVTANATSAAARPTNVVVTDADGFKGLLVIDGVISDPGALRTLPRDRIQQVDVIKGAAATAVYDDPRAANGVIRIITRAGADR